MNLYKFGQNPSTGSEDSAQKRGYADADRIRTIKTIIFAPSLRLGAHKYCL